jgi:outer membrane protein assembly factor BamB
MCRVSALGMLLVFGTAAPAEDWPQWLGPRRDASTTEKVAPWTVELKVLWRQPVAGEGNSSPVVAGGRVFLHTKVGDEQKEQLTALDAETGKIQWKEAYPRARVTTLYGNGPRATPAIADGRIFTFGLSGLLTCWSAQEGKQLWQVDTVKDARSKSLMFGPSCSPLVEKGAVLLNVGAKGASIVAFDPMTGKVLWKALDDGPSYSSPIAFGDGASRQVVFLTQEGLVSLNPADGTLYWRSPLKDKIFESSTTPVRVQDMLIGSSITIGSVGLQLADKDQKPAASEKWKNPALTCYFSTPVPIGADLLYMVIGEMDLNPFARKKPAASLRCVETRTGKELWKKENVGSYHASLVRTGDNKLVMLEEQGDLVLVEPGPARYVELARTKICGSTWVHPAIANGRLYIRDAKELICVQLSP